MLTRDQYDVKGRCVFEFWVKSEIGVCQLFVHDEKPVCFVREQDTDGLMAYIQLQKLGVITKPLQLTTFDGLVCCVLYSKSLKDFFALRRLAKSLNVELLEDDIKPVDRFLMERFVKNELTFTGQELSVPNGKFRRFTNCLIKSSNYQLASSDFVSVDIECDETGRLFSIGLHQPNVPEREVVLYHYSDEVKQPEQLNHDVSIEWLNNEKDLLVRLNQLIQEWDPDFIVGWNFIKFDIRILTQAAKRHGIELSLGRDQTALKYSSGLREGEQQYPDKAYCSGRVIIDGIDVLKNATYHFDSYSLDFVSQALLNDRKLITEDNGLSKLAEIKRQYIEEPEKLANYNLQDCKLVSKIFVKENLIEFLYTRSRLTGLELDRVGGSVAAFTNLYLPMAHRRGWIAPNLVKPEDYRHSPGGFVMDSKPGFHKDVLVFDFKSLYPSIIRTFNIDPVALLEADRELEADLIQGFRGGNFSRTPSILSRILDELWVAREKAKSDGDKVLSNAIKIIMNSFYGVLGSSGCRFYDTKLASSITMRGHWVLNESKLWFENKGLAVIYGDTDSIFVCLDDTGFKAEDAISLQFELNAWFQQKLTDEFKLNSKLEMEFETHFSPFFMPTIRGTDSGSKKRYAGKRVLSDGNSELVVKGLESVRSDWTELAKQFQVKLLELIFEGRDYLPYINETVLKLRASKLDHMLVYNKRIRQPLDNYRKTTPPHIKAARMANNVYGMNVYKKGSRIAYVIGVQGPEVLGIAKTPINYEHYVDKQLFPIAESLLGNFPPAWRAVFEHQISLL